VRHVLAELEALRVAVNRQMLLGLLEFEGHFARYEPGTGYERHYDQFRGTSRRQLTVTLYLNEDWRAAYGGNLRIHLDDADSPRAIDVMPAGGTLVSFLSARFAHEVLPATRQRLAMTGWFLRRD
jgi:SM-20-related protein